MFSDYKITQLTSWVICKLIFKANERCKDMKETLKQPNKSVWMLTVNDII